MIAGWSGLGKPIRKARVRWLGTGNPRPLGKAVGGSHSNLRQGSFSLPFFSSFYFFFLDLSRDSDNLDDVLGGRASASFLFFGSHPAAVSR